MTRRAALWSCVAVTLAGVSLAAVTGGAAATSGGSRVLLPPAAGRADYQLGGSYPPPSGTRIVERDRSARPAAHAYGVCYLNGYQTQPEQNRWWTAQHPGLLLRDKVGRTVEDPGWPDELLLDTSTSTKRATIAQIEAGWIDGCARAGFLAVEADNLDSWTRSRGLLHPDGNMALARLLNAHAHAKGLANAQKNTPELAAQGRRLGFDFAVAEECGVFHECAAYTRAYGGRVIEVEYTDNGRAAYITSCAAASGSRSILLRDRQLITPGGDGYAYQSC